MPQVPRRLAHVGIELEQGPWSLSATGRYVSRRYSTDTNGDTTFGVYTAYDSYALVDLKLGYRFSERVALALAVDNLLDREYFNYYRAPARSGFLNIDFRF